MPTVSVVHILIIYSSCSGASFFLEGGEKEENKRSEMSPLIVRSEEQNKDGIGASVGREEPKMQRWNSSRYSPRSESM